MRALFILACGAAWVLTISGPEAVSSDSLPPVARHSGANHGLASSLANLFVENKGRLDEAVRFHVPGSGRTLYFTADGVTIALDGIDRRWALKLDFLGANPDVVVRGEKMQKAVVSYFRGNDPEKWQSGCPTYARIVYDNLWPGVDLVYRGEANRLKHEFVVAPGADPGRIRIAVRGATAARLGADGSLILETPLGSFEDARPVAYQEREGARLAVSASYALDGQRLGFDLGAFDPSLPLVLDPETIVASAFLGGSGTDRGHGIAVDGSGAAYLTGETNSGDFPAAGGLDPTYNGGDDAFVVKVNAEGTALVYAAYLGGSNRDAGHAVAVDPSGAAYVAGVTTSPDFPIAGSLDPTYGGTGDAFVAKVNADGTALVYSAYLGGSNGEYGFGVAADAAGAAYVTGLTYSADFPTAGTFGPTFHGGHYDAFVTKVDPQGSALAWSGFLGGSEDEQGQGLCVDASGAVYVTGSTSSADFPSVGGFGSAYGGYDDAFVAKVDAAGSALAYSGFLGGGFFDGGRGIAVDASGAAYVTGYTASVDFPTVGGFDPSLSGELDAFIAKVDAPGGSIVYSGFLGGSYRDEGFAVAVDASGAAYVTGYTASVDFPTSGGLDPSYNGGQDAFLAKVNAQGTALAFGGHLGGSALDRGLGIALDAAGAVHLTGLTRSADFPTAGDLDPSYNGGTDDAFVTKLFVPDSSTCRSGTLGVSTGPLPPVVLRINGSEGDADRVVVTTIGSPIVITMDAPPLGPTPAPFAMYGWVGEPNASTVTPHPKGVGAMCFPTPVTGGLPQPNRIWNNIGHPAILGSPHFPSEPAPSTPLSKAGGISIANTATFQGFIFDDGSSASHPASITNAVILRVVP